MCEGKKLLQYGTKTPAIWSSHCTKGVIFDAETAQVPASQVAGKSRVLMLGQDASLPQDMTERGSRHGSIQNIELCLGPRPRGRPRDYKGLPIEWGEGNNVDVKNIEGTITTHMFSNHMERLNGIFERMQTPDANTERQNYPAIPLWTSEVAVSNTLQSWLQCMP
jgi:hypothetical protein